MSDPSKPANWLNKIPGWLKAMWASIAALAAAIIAFKDNWRYYIIAAVTVIPAYLLVASVYVLFARRKTRSKKNQWTYRYGNQRFLGLVGLALVLLFLMVPVLSPTARTAGMWSQAVMMILLAFGTRLQARKSCA